jgi:putative ABC transport system permease protein
VSPLNKVLWRDLWHLRGQVLATAAVVACGVASFVSMRGTYEALLGARTDYYQAYRFAHVFAQLKRAPEGLARRIQEIPGVAAVRTRVVMEVTLDVPGLKEPATGRLVAIPERPRAMLNDLHLRQGHYVEPGHDDQVLASEAFAMANRLKVGDRIGAILNGRWKRLHIAGIALSPEYIYEVGHGSIIPDNKRFGVLWMSREALGPAFNMEGGFNDVAIALSYGVNEAEVIAQIDRLLGPYGGLGAYGREDQVSHRFISDEISQNRITSTYVPAIFLSVAAFLLHIVLSRLVALRRTEIGLLKAFGYSDTTVGLHYLKLAFAGVAVGVLLGTVAGVYLGTKLTSVYRDYYHFPKLVYQVSASLIALSVMIALLAAGLGAWNAVRRAMALPPAEAMRPEPPADYRAGMIEHTGLQNLLPASARMILRNLGRHRWKSFLTTLAIGLATGILVLGSFFYDAVQYLMQVQFGFVHRHDVALHFHEPRTAAVRYELTRLPGVLVAEPYRSVPVRVRFGHRSRRLSLEGLHPGARLRQLIDVRLNPIEVPAEGLLMTAKLAEVLGASVGDMVIVEVLEGRRPVRDIPLVQLVDEPVGFGAYMAIQSLSQLIEEDRSVSGAYLRVDTRVTERLYDELKRMPVVAGVAIRAAMLRSFEEIMQRSVIVSTMINIGFACVIAFGVIYNGTRVTLSERGNELASLRVLGFQQQEVAMILLGEQAVLTLLAIPLGWVLGYGTAAYLSQRLSTEFFRLPFLITSSTLLQATAVVFVSALVSGYLVARRLKHLDLIAVLKTRE